MPKIKCIIHNKEFDFPENIGNYPHRCPWCLQDEIVKLRNDYDEVREQRDALLKAFEIKRTYELIGK